jgi:hypothetical protein
MMGGNMKWLSSRPRPAFVIAVGALFVALGGGAYAATALPANSVGTQQLKDNAVTSAKVRDHSLLKKDFKPGQLPAGPRGRRGLTGAPGPTGPSDGYSISTDNGGSFDTTFPGWVGVDLPLPAGSYIVSASGFGLNTDTSTKALACRLWDRASASRFAYSFNDVPAGEHRSFALTGSVTVGQAGSTIALQCQGIDTSDLGVESLNLDAIRVGTLHTVT